MITLISILDPIALIVGYANIVAFSMIIVYVIVNELRLVMKEKGGVE